MANLLAASGKITFLRAHDMGTGYGPNTDFIDGEVVIKLNTDQAKSFGFQMRNDTMLPSRTAMFDLLCLAYWKGKTVTIDYFIDPNKVNGRILRVALTG